MTKIIVCLEAGFMSVRSDIQRLGHQITNFNYHGSTPDFIQACKEGSFDLMVIDLGAPITQQFKVLDRLVQELPEMPIILFNVMPNEWAAYCKDKHPTVTVTGISYEQYTAAVDMALAT